jgi:hypothetical protein
MVVESYISSIINVATPIVPMLNSTENLQPINNDMDVAIIGIGFIKHVMSPFKTKLYVRSTHI